ncbi:hypothetical protein CEXT_692731 [Caerostris extrusa]|uniref:Uncharacterized protein n=1 Tax=Caerostris extrusa TaxID=172846 RepID=A0AAV4QZE6_CAEEX|nr:hypothetical protein CEXT_692731 [Caerostris extrusa]
MSALSQKEERGPFSYWDISRTDNPFISPGEARFRWLLRMVTLLSRKKANYIMMGPSGNKRNATSAKREKPFCRQEEEINGAEDRKKPVAMEGFLMSTHSQKKREGHFLIGTSQELTILLFRPGNLGLGGILEWLLSCPEKTLTPTNELPGAKTSVTVITMHEILSEKSRFYNWQRMSYFLDIPLLQANRKQLTPCILVGKEAVSQRITEASSFREFNFCVSQLSCKKLGRSEFWMVFRGIDSQGDSLEKPFNGLRTVKDSGIFGLYFVQRLQEKNCLPYA